MDTWLCCWDFSGECWQCMFVLHLHPQIIVTHHKHWLECCARTSLKPILGRWLNTVYLFEQGESSWRQSGLWLSCQLKTGYSSFPWRGVEATGSVLPLKISVGFIFFGWVTECSADIPGLVWVFFVPRQTLFANLCVMGELSVVVLHCAFVGSLHFGDFLTRQRERGGEDYFNLWRAISVFIK